ncbi:hormogonium polysaccharide biosynthesis protein HpsL [Alkalinema pantanalense CENA528]|uniref:hormogonium polysaccharide biosynthesis protein HpsL n=1 Tax=Alkalinema pantanalense TaxID=1620705 RepID=UPI003D6FB408
MAKSNSRKSSKASKAAKRKAAEAMPELSDRPVLTLKEQQAAKRKAAKAKQELTQFLTIATVCAVFVGMLLAIVAGVKGAVGGIVGTLVLLLSFKYPWQAIYGFWIYLPLGGTITYSIGGGSNPVLQLAKDIFYLPALIATIQLCQRKKLPFILPTGLKTPLLLLVGYCLLVLLFVNGAQQLAPKGDKPFLMGILGLKVFLGYVPLISCAYYFLNKRSDFYRLMRITTGLIILCCSLAFVQYMMLKTGRCQGTVGSGAELFKASLGARCLVGGSLLYNEEQGVIRLPGTFVAPWQWGWFLISAAFFSFATAFSDRSFLWRLAGMGAMAATLTMAVLSGQRIALAIVPIVFAVLLVVTGQVANLKRFLPIGITLGIFAAIAMAAYPDVVQERLDSFSSRWEAAPPTEFIASQFDFVSDLTGILGRGLGRATNSARSFGETKLIETYYPKVLFEIGPIGVLLFLAVVTTLTVVTFRAYRQLKDKNLRGMGAALWVFILFISYNTYYYPLDVDPVAVYYWFMAGALLKLPELEKTEVPALAEAATPPPKGKRRQPSNRSK